jgi:hypothetical protein
MALDQKSQDILRSILGDKTKIKSPSAPAGTPAATDGQPPTVGTTPTPPAQQPAGGGTPPPPPTSPPAGAPGTPPENTQQPTGTDQGDASQIPEKGSLETFDGGNNAVLERIDSLSEAFDHLNENLVAPMLQEKRAKTERDLKQKIKEAYEADDHAAVDRYLDQIKELGKESASLQASQIPTSKQLQKQISPEEQNLINFYKTTYPDMQGTPQDKQMARNYFNLLATVKDPKVRVQMLSGMISSTVATKTLNPPPKKPVAPVIKNGPPAAPAGITIKDVPLNLVETGRKLNMTDEKITAWYKGRSSK